VASKNIALPQAISPWHVVESSFANSKPSLPASSTRFLAVGLARVQITPTNIRPTAITPANTELRPRAGVTSSVNVKLFAKFKAKPRPPQQITSFAAVGGLPFWLSIAQMV